MTSVDNVADISPIAQYTASGGQTVFSFPFPIFEDDNLVVYDNDTLQVLTTDYSVTGEGADTGGNVTFVTGRTAGHIITIYRDVAMERLTDFQQNGPRRSADMNDELDRITMYVQQLKRDLGKKIGVPTRSALDGDDLTLDPISDWFERFLFINASGELEPAASIGDAIITQSVIGGFLYPRTAAEIAAGVTPTFYNYPELHVKRYGAVGDASTNDITAFNNCALVAKQYGSGTIIIDNSASAYLLQGPWNLTDGTSGGAQVNWVIRGERGGPETSCLLIKHTGHAIDCTGASAIHWYDLSITTDATTYPDVGFFLSRCAANASGGGSQYMRFTNVSINGKFSICNRYNYGSENIVDVGCEMYNSATDANRKVCITTSNNSRSLTSTFVTVSTPPRSTIDHKIYGGEYAIMSTTNGATADVFELDQIRHFRVRDAWVLGNGSRSIVYFNPTNGTSDHVLFSGIDVENGVSTPQYFAYYAAAGALQQPVGHRYEYCYAATSARFLFADTNVRLTNLYLIGNEESSGSQGLQVIELNDSNIINDSMRIQITTSTRNNLVGTTDNWFITTRTDDMWTDTSTANKTWTPNTGALTITGALTVSNKRIGLVGNKQFFAVSLQAATSIVCANNTSLTGLPFSASVQSADVNVTNGTTGASIGNGYVFGTTIKLPAINVLTDTITISGSSFVA